MPDHISYLTGQKKYPDWAETQLEIREDGNEYSFFQFAKSPERVRAEKIHEESVGEGPKRRATTV